LSQLGSGELSSTVSAISREKDAPDLNGIEERLLNLNVGEREGRLLVEFACTISEFSSIESAMAQEKREIEEIKRKLTESRRMLLEERSLFETYSEDNSFLKRAIHSVEEEGGF
jgi:hypothetical protein